MLKSVTAPRYVDLTGYSFSGKSAAYDLLTAGAHFKKFGKEVEFDLIRSRGGIFDLYDSISLNWTLQRSSVAIRDFRRLTHYLGGGSGWVDRVIRGGSRYDLHFPGFSSIVQDYVKSLVIASWNGYWPFSDYAEHPVLMPFQKLRKKLGRVSYRVDVARLEPSDFVSATREFTDKLAAAALNGNAGAVVTSNALSPHAPQAGMEFFSDIRCIVVDRDPRDVYLSALDSPDPKVGRAAIGESVFDFIKRYRMVREGVGGNHPQVKRIFFEDLVCDFDDCRRELGDFLEVPVTALLPNASTGFHPEKSKHNVQMWLDNKRYSMQRLSILEIESELQPYLRT